MASVGGWVGGRGDLWRHWTGRYAVRSVNLVLSRDIWLSPSRDTVIQMREFVTISQFTCCSIDSKNEIETSVDLLLVFKETYICSVHRHVYSLVYSGDTQRPITEIQYCPMSNKVESIRRVTVNVCELLGTWHITYTVILRCVRDQRITKPNKKVYVAHIGHENSLDFRFRWT